jgi:hypothetical protein
VSDLLWGFAQWLGASPGRVGGCVLACVVVGFFGGFWTKRRRR